MNPDIEIQPKNEQQPRQEAIYSPKDLRTTWRTCAPKATHKSMFAEHVWFIRIRSDHREAEKVRVERRMEASRLCVLCDETFSSAFLIEMKLAAML